MRFLSPVEQAYLNGTRDFTKAQRRYIKCRLKRKLRLLNEERCNAAARLQRLDSMVAQPGRALTTTNHHDERKNEPWTGFEPVTSTYMGRGHTEEDLYLTKVTLYQAELPRQPNGQSSQ
jgi:hypothetical protein